MKKWLSRKKRSVERRLRVEHFGAIAQLSWPRALVFVDRDFARTLGIRSSAHWDKGPEEVGARPLTAPLEAHLQITNRCDAGCKGCYTAATPNAQREWPIEKWKATIDELAEMGVFHLALAVVRVPICPGLANSCSTLVTRVWFQT